MYFKDKNVLKTCISSTTTSRDSSFKTIGEISSIPRTYFFLNIINSYVFTQNSNITLLLYDTEEIIILNFILPHGLNVISKCRTNNSALSSLLLIQLQLLSCIRTLRVGFSILSMAFHNELLVAIHGLINSVKVFIERSIIP